MIALAAALLAFSKAMPGHLETLRSAHSLADQRCAIIDRVDCSGRLTPAGFALDISQTDCESRGCCYDPSAARLKCYYAAEGVAVTHVHVVNSNHFDAGYADLTSIVINEYFDYFPMAASVGANLGAPLQWLTQSWLVSLYLDCPLGLGLACPGASAVAAFNTAVKAGHITWHAYPTNAELALADAAMVTFGIELTHELDAQFGRAPSTVVSTRDVTGMPRSALPILAKAGVTAVSEGMNGRIQPYNVPPAFVWRDEASSTDLLALWHWSGYGKLADPGAALRLPGSSHALVYAWRGDNAGPPPTAADAKATLKNASAFFPNATTVEFSTLDAFVAAVHAAGADQQLPVITKEMDDTWVWGAASDPFKTAAARVFRRQRVACVARGAAECSKSSAALRNASRLSLKNEEHTWGVSVAHYFPTNFDGHWSNVEFQQQLARNSSDFAVMAASWEEQRRIGLYAPLEALGPQSELAAAVRAEWRELRPAETTHASLAAEGFAEFDASTTSVRLGAATVRVDGRGALSSLVDGNGREWAGGGGLGLLQYQTLVLEEFFGWWKEYLLNYNQQHPQLTSGWNEYGKPGGFMKHGLPGNQTVQPTLATPTLRSAWRRRGSDGGVSDAIALELVFSPELHADFGAPRVAWVRWEAAAGVGTRLNVSVDLIDKTATRLPEATYFGFTPAGAAAAAWAMDKLGGWVDPLDVVDGAARGLHAVSTGVEFRPSKGANDARIFFETLDAPIVRWDAPLPFPTPTKRQPALGNGAAFLLHDNIWNTNYPFWYPWAAGDENLRFRFAVHLP